MLPSNRAGPMTPRRKGTNAVSRTMPGLCCRIQIAGGSSEEFSRRSAVPTNISRSWTALANQLESLLVIEKSEAM